MKNGSVRAALIIVPVLAAFTAASSGSLSCRPAPGALGAGSWDHIVVVWEENKDASEVAGLPFIAGLRAAGRTYSQSFGVARPSQPNYLAAFAGGTLGVADNLDHDLDAPTLDSSFRGAGLSMLSYAEGLPSAGFRGTSSGRYVRRHNPAASFPAVPDSAILPFSAFPSDYGTLPQLCFVIPDLDHDMHDGTALEGDAWLRANLGAYADWARGHRSLLVLTFDEPDVKWGPDLNHPILTVFVGQGIAAGEVDDTPIDIYALSDYLLACFGLPGLRP